MAAVRRRFTLFDALALIAAIAVGLASARFYGENRTDLLSVRLGDYLVAWLIRITIVLFLVSVAIAALRLKQPRPSLRRVCTQPGFTACAVVTIASAFEVLDSLVFFALPVYQNANGVRNVLFGGIRPACFAPAILGVWSIQLAGRRWCPESSWLDRSGRALGVFWIAATVTLTTIAVLL